MDTSLSPSLTAISIIGILIALALLVVAFRLQHWKRIVLTVTSLLILATSALLATPINPWLIDTRYRTYRSFYRDIEIGMNRAEVLNLIDRHYPDSAPT
ncbi:MAG: hypothetical protein ACI9UA_005520 [Pseudoalteromonas tetraodonis]|jgi:uncharacterized protein (DUF983 family)